jgi:hypothetical protein
MTDTQHYRDKWATYDARLKEGDGNGSLMGACFIIAKSGVTDIYALCDRIDELEAERRRYVQIEVVADDGETMMVWTERGQETR